MLDAVFHQGLQQHAGYHDIEGFRIKMFVDAQLLPAKASDLDVEVIVDEFHFFAKLHKFIVLAQQAAQDFRELHDQIAGFVGIESHQRGNGIQGIEEKMRVNLALQGVKPGFQQQLCLLLQLHLNAGIIPDLNRDRNGRDHSRENRQHGHRRGQVKREKLVGKEIFDLQAGSLQGDNDEKESCLPVNARILQIAS